MRVRAQRNDSGQATVRDVSGRGRRATRVALLFAMVAACTAPGGRSPDREQGGKGDTQGSTLERFVYSAATLTRPADFAVVPYGESAGAMDEHVAFETSPDCDGQEGCYLVFKRPCEETTLGEDIVEQFGVSKACANPLLGRAFAALIALSATLPLASGLSLPSDIGQIALIPSGDWHDRRDWQFPLREMMSRLLNGLPEGAELPTPVALASTLVFWRLVRSAAGEYTLFPPLDHVSRDEDVQPIRLVVGENAVEIETGLVPVPAGAFQLPDGSWMSDGDRAELATIPGLFIADAGSPDPDDENGPEDKDDPRFDELAEHDRQAILRHERKLKHLEATIRRGEMGNADKVAELVTNSLRARLPQAGNGLRAEVVGRGVVSVKGRLTFLGMRHGARVPASNPGLTNQPGVLRLPGLMVRWSRGETVVYRRYIAYVTKMPATDGRLVRMGVAPERYVLDRYAAQVGISRSPNLQFPARGAGAPPFRSSDVGEWAFILRQHRPAPLDISEFHAPRALTMHRWPK